MIYIGIPVRDERHTIGPLLWRIRELLIGIGRDFHVLVVDDASEDGTPELVEPYRQILPLTLIRHEAPLGYSASLERIVRESVDRSNYVRRDALVTMQADFTDAPETVPELLRRFEGGADLVVGAPAARTVEPRRQTAVRLAARLVARRLPTPADVNEPFGSLRLYRLFVLAGALRAAGGRPRLLEHEGWAANAELLVRTSPFVRRFDEVESARSFGRRYRDSRFEWLEEVRQLRTAAKDASLTTVVAAAEPQVAS